MTQRSTTSKRRRRRLLAIPIVLISMLVILVSIRTAVAEVYYVPTAVVAPEVPRGSHVLVSKLSRAYEPGQIIAYRNAQGAIWLGRVAAVDEASGRIDLSRNAPSNGSVRMSDVVGRVVLNTR